MDARRAYDIAAYLYDGGWRAEDRDEIAELYAISVEDAQRIADALDSMEA